MSNLVHFLTSQFIPQTVDFEPLKLVEKAKIYQIDMEFNNHDIKVKVKQKSIAGHIFGLFLLVVITYRSISEYKYTLLTPQYYSPGGSFLTSLI